MVRYIQERIFMSIKKRTSAFFHLNLHILIDIIGAVLVWRGVWVLADRYLFPDHPDISAVVSIFIGILILYIEDRKLKELL